MVLSVFNAAIKAAATTIAAAAEMKIGKYVDDGEQWIVESKQCERRAPPAGVSASDRLTTHYPDSLGEQRLKLIGFTASQQSTNQRQHVAVHVRL